jgi:hypothetical protein
MTINADVVAGYMKKILELVPTTGKDEVAAFSIAVLMSAATIARASHGIYESCDMDRIMELCDQMLESSKQ